MKLSRFHTFGKNSIQKTKNVTLTNPYMFKYLYIYLLQWPYCDGAHGEHNKLTGDNLGPVVIKRKGA